MSEPRVTITLGRGGQRVVKRAGPISDGVRSDSLPLSGSKRPIRERLGRNVGNSLSSNKRHRGDDMRLSSGSGRLDDAQVGRNDLRLKLMRKRLSRQKEEAVRTDYPPRRVNMMHHMPDMKETTLYRQLARTESADDFLLRKPPRESNSSWTLNGSRHRSPDRILSTSRGFSPPRHADGLQPVSSVRPLDASRNGRYLYNDYVNPPRPLGPAPMTRKDPSEYAKPIAQPASTGGIVQKSSYMVPRPPTAGEEPLTVAGFLNSLGLGKYSILFQAEEVDMTALKQMGDNDLKELGIPMGPRKKILLALLPRSKRQPP